MSILIISFWSNLAPRSEVRANSSRIVFNVAKDWAATFTSPMICQDIVKTLSRHCQDMSRRRQLETVSRTVSITFPIWSIWSIWSICNTPMIFLRIFYHIYAILCTSLHVSHLACLSSSFPNLSQPSTTFPTGSTWFNVPPTFPNVPPWSIWSHHVPPAAGHSPVYISSSMSPGASSACAPLPDGVSTVGRRLQGDVSKVSNSEIIVWLVRSL
jgi:hypothetical protein